SRASQTYPSIFLYARGQYDSTEVFWRAKMSDPNTLVRIGALATLSNLSLLRGRLQQANDYALQTRKLQVARGVPASPMTDSVNAAAIDIWYLGQPERGVRALDAAQAAVSLKSLPVEQRPYFTFANLYSWAGRPDKARAMLAQFEAEVRDPAVRRSAEPGRHA